MFSCNFYLTYNFYSKSDCKLDLQDNEEVPTRSAAHRTADGAGADHETAMDEDEVTRLKALLKARDNQIARMHEKAEEDRFIHESDIARLEQDVRALRWENSQPWRSSKNGSQLTWRS